MHDRRARVLLIEDDPGDAELVFRGLATRDPADGFQIASVPTLAEGLRELERKATDVLLLDLFLPDSRGDETLRRIREAEPDLPIVILSGAADDSTAFAALRGGADDYFVKGESTPASLRRSIRHARERQQIRRERHQLQERIAQAQKQRACERWPAVSRTTSTIS
jgi:DNA-binding response OmpR family regulator